MNRKGKNNTLTPGPDDVGSPWAIGAAEGGHKSILPELGTLEDFRSLVQKAREHGIDIALDIALQCAPDHPYVKQHPDWFRWRPDGTVQYAENPPKKYQDIYPFNFETADWQALWIEIKSIFAFWIEQGVRIFRVDNPHTKPFAMWEWLIGEIKQTTPDAIFLAEAFTRPKSHAPAGQARLHPVLHLLCLAQYQMGVGRVPDRTVSGTGPRVFPPQFLAEHPGYL
jgi:starch synthase (maltosyl-transferring)